MNSFPLLSLGSVVSRTRLATIVVLLALSLNGCKSTQQKAEEQALAQAKQQAATSGVAQQFTSTDKDGNVTTTTVQPPQAGQTAQVVTTTVTPKSQVQAAAQAPDGTQPNAVQAPAAPAPAVQAGVPQVSTPQPVPPPPVSINVAAGTTLVIRVDQTISAKGSRAGDTFTGEVVEPVTDSSGKVVIPKKSPVGGEVVAAKQRGHFKGASDIELRLTSLTLDGKQYPLDTRDVQRTKKGKGKRTAAFIGGGSGLGMLIGGLAGGGKGVLIGGLAGAGAGTAGAGLTGNRDLVIPAESIVRFKLADDLVIEP